MRIAIRKTRRHKAAVTLIKNDCRYRYFNTTNNRTGLTIVKRLKVITLYSSPDFVDLVADGGIAPPSSVYEADGLLFSLSAASLSKATIRASIPPV